MAKPETTSPEQPSLFVLPIADLLEDLQQAGFARDRFGYTTHLRIQQLLGQLQAEALPETVKYKLAALLCQSAEEQAKFHTIFDGLVELARKRFEGGGPHPPPPPPVEPPPPPPPPPTLPPKEEDPVKPEERPKGGHRSDAVKAARSGPISVELKFRDDGYRPWNVPGLEAVVRPFREKEPTGIEEWDIPKSIDKTIRTGGAPNFVRRRRRKAPQYLILIEEKSARDHLAGFYADLAIELSRRDVDAEYYFYHHLPLACWKDRRDPGTYTSLDRLHAEYAHARLILIGEPDGLLAKAPKPKDPAEKYLAQTLLYPSEFAFQLKDDWASVALLNPRSTALWGGPEEAIHYLFPVVPASLRGLGSLMDQWVSHLSIRPYYWKLEHPEPVPPQFHHFDLEPEAIQGAIRSLRSYLGKQGFTWLCAISVYPELYWQLTKILHDEAISAADVPDEAKRTQLWHLTLSRLCKLDWLRRGSIPPEYRQELRKALPDVNAADVRRQLLEVLQLDENKPPEGSYAEKDRVYTVALLDHERMVAQEQPDEVRLKAMQEKLKEEVLNRGVAVSDIEDAIGRSLFQHLPEVQAETTKNYWVLWVDDNPGNNTGFQEEVSKEEAIRFVNATSTTHALTTLEVQKFDLIISDVSRHGDKDAGIKMMDKFRDAGVKTPVIFFTHPNYVSSSRELLLSKGAVEVVSGFAQLKPIFWEEIAKKRSENEDNLFKISFLERALKASKAVCRIVLQNGSLGTGFLTEGNYLFTCNHILNNPEAARDAKIEFNYEVNPQGEISQPVEYRLDVSDFITSDVKELDFTRVKVLDREDAPLSQWGVLDLEPANIPVENESVILIRHHLGEPKSLDMSETIGALDRYFYYADGAEKSPGSAGGPILNGRMKVVAIHHARQDNKAILGKTRTVREGILMGGILAFIEQYKPQQPANEVLLNQAASTLDLGREKLKDGDLNAAYELFQKAQALYAEAQYPAGSAETLHETGKLAMLMRNFEEADRSLQSALALYQSLQFESSQAFVLMDLGKLYRQMDYPVQAEKHYLEAQDLLEGLYGDTEAEQAEIRQALEQIRERKSGSAPAAETAPMQTLFRAGALKILAICHPEDEVHVQGVNRHLQRLSFGEEISFFNMQHPPEGENPIDRALFELPNADHVLVFWSEKMAANNALAELAGDAPAIGRSVMPVQVDRVWDFKSTNHLPALPNSSKNATIRQFEDPEDAYLVVARDFEALIEKEKEDFEHANRIYDAEKEREAEMAKWDYENSREFVYDLLMAGRVEEAIDKLRLNEEGTLLLNRWKNLVAVGSWSETLIEQNQLLQTILELTRKNLRPDPEKNKTVRTRLDIRELVGQYKIPEALTALCDSVSPDFEEEARLLAARWGVLKRFLDLNLATYEDSRTEETKIMEGIVILAGSLPDDTSSGASKGDPYTRATWEDVVELITEGYLEEAFVRMEPNYLNNKVFSEQWREFQAEKTRWIRGVINWPQYYDLRVKQMEQLLLFVNNNLKRKETRPKVAMNKSALDDLISKVQIEPALIELRKSVSREREPAVILLQVRWAIIKRDVMLGTVTRREASAFENAIIGEMLQLVSREAAPADKKSSAQRQPNRQLDANVVRELIAEGETAAALEHLRGARPEDLDVIALTARFNRLNQDRLQGLISRQDEEIRVAQVRNGILMYIDQISPETTKAPETTSIETQIQEVRSLINQNRLEEALVILIKIYPDESRVRLLSAEFYSLRSEQLRGTISEENYQIGISKICATILGLMEKIPKNEPESKSEQGSFFQRIFGTNRPKKK